MTSRLLCAALLLSLAASASISQVQSIAKWTCSGSAQTVTCIVTTNSGVSSGHLLVVWTFWESSNPSGGTYPYTAGVDDSSTGGGNNTWYSAVGPTLQLAASTPTTAQIFYAKKTNASSSSGDPIRVTYNCLWNPTTGQGNPACTTTPSISLAGVVAAEYSGADTQYPLDSVSAGFSTSGNQTSLLDSGTVAPANSNLLVFAGGISDNGTVSAGSGFAAIQSHSFTNGGAITEQNNNAITGNNLLQRASATIGGVVPPVGNWLMQMAIFRDASWTVSRGWTPIRDAATLYADQYPGATADIQLNNAIADAVPGQVIEYRCAQGATLPQFGATVSTAIAVDIRLGPCVFQGPPGDGTTNNPMFTIAFGANGSPSGVVIEGSSRFGGTTLESMCNKCDTIHFNQGPTETSSWWLIQNLQFTDVFCPGTNCTTNRTGGAAIYVDAAYSSNGIYGSQLFAIHNVRVNGMYNQLVAINPQNSTISDFDGISSVSTGIIIGGPATGIVCISCHVIKVQAASANNRTDSDSPPHKASHDRKRSLWHGKRNSSRPMLLLLDHRWPIRRQRWVRDLQFECA